VLLLSFHLGEGAYAMPCKQVVEVVPMVKLDPVPGAGPYVTGQFDYRGQVVPVIDLRRLVAGEPCRACLSTRIILVEQLGADRRMRPIGLLAERVTETINEDPKSIKPAAVHVDELKFLGGVFIGPERMIRLVDVDALCESIRVVTSEAGAHVLAKREGP
jgi:chemotaxis-related protein WspB